MQQNFQGQQRAGPPQTGGTAVAPPTAQSTPAAPLSREDRRAERQRRRDRRETLRRSESEDLAAAIAASLADQQQIQDGVTSAAAATQNNVTAGEGAPTSPQSQHTTEATLRPTSSVTSEQPAPESVNNQAALERQQSLLSRYNSNTGLPTPAQSQSHGGASQPPVTPLQGVSTPNTGAYNNSVNTQQPMVAQPQNTSTGSRVNNANIHTPPNPPVPPQQGRPNFLPPQQGQQNRPNYLSPQQGHQNHMNNPNNYNAASSQQQNHMLNGGAANNNVHNTGGPPHAANFHSNMHSSQQQPPNVHHMNVGGNMVPVPHPSNSVNPNINSRSVPGQQFGGHPSQQYGGSNFPFRPNPHGGVGQSYGVNNNMNSTDPRMNNFAQQQQQRSNVYTDDPQVVANNIGGASSTMAINPATPPTTADTSPPLPAWADDVVPFLACPGSSEEDEEDAGSSPNSSESGMSGSFMSQLAEEMENAGNNPRPQRDPDEDHTILALRTNSHNSELDGPRNAPEEHAAAPHTDTHSEEVINNDTVLGTADPSIPAASGTGPSNNLQVGYETPRNVLSRNGGAISTHNSNSSTGTTTSNARASSNVYTDDTVGENSERANEIPTVNTPDGTSINAIIDNSNDINNSGMNRSIRSTSNVADDGELNSVGAPNSPDMAHTDSPSEGPLQSFYRANSSGQNQMHNRRSTSPRHMNNRRTYSSEQTHRHSWVQRSNRGRPYSPRNNSSGARGNNSIYRSSSDAVASGAAQQSCDSEQDGELNTLSTESETEATAAPTPATARRQSSRAGGRQRGSRESGIVSR